MKIHCLQHVEHEDPGYILNWIKENNHSISYTKFFEKKIYYPDLDEFDFLLIMGGTMGVYEENKYQWLRDEKKFVLEAINNRKIVLGICLGAQIIAASLGKEVYKNRYKEIGWYPIRLTAEAEKSDVFKGLPNEMTVFHWHGDTFDLPENSIHLAENDAAKNQAFLYNDRVLGLQFHFETTEDIIHRWMDDEDLKITKFVQNKDKIFKLTERFVKINNKYLITVLNNLSVY